MSVFSGDTNPLVQLLALVIPLWVVAVSLCFLQRQIASFSTLIDLLAVIYLAQACAGFLVLSTAFSPCSLCGSSWPEEVYDRAQGSPPLPKSWHGGVAVFRTSVFAIFK